MLESEIKTDMNHNIGRLAVEPQASEPVSLWKLACERWLDRLTTAGSRSLVQPSREPAMSHRA